MSVPTLWIPRKGWAKGLVAWMALEDGEDGEQADSFAKVTEGWRLNLLEMVRWSRDIRCDDDYTQADWTTIVWHPPAEMWSPGNAESVYASLERWAGKVCQPLHVPYKRWGWDQILVPELEEANWLTIQRWASGIGACCEGGGGPG